MEANFSSRLAVAIERSGAQKKDIAEALGVKPPALSRWLSGSVPDVKHLTALAAKLNVSVNWLIGNPGRTSEIIEVLPGDVPPPRFIPTNLIPLISWAHAGEAASYEELPQDWQEMIPTTCKAIGSFALCIEGDSMEPYCNHGDLAIIMPHEEPRNGKLVVAKLKNDGVVLRRFGRTKDTIRLTPHNPAYPPADYNPSEFHWIYPVHSLVKKEWD